MTTRHWMVFRDEKFIGRLITTKEGDANEVIPAGQEVDVKLGDKMMLFSEETV